MNKRILIATSIILIGIVSLIGCNAGSRGVADGSFSGLANATVPTGLATIAGIVTDADAQPVAGAVVSLYSGALLVTSATTGNNGSYSLTAAPGTYELRVSKSEYTTLVQSVTLEAGQTKPGNVSLSKTPAAAVAKLRGFITDEAYQAQDGALVRLIPQVTGGSGAEVTTGSDGAYSLTVQPGTYTLSVFKSGFGTNQQIIYLAANEERFLDVRLSAKVTMVGTVKLDTTQQPISNVVVEAYQENTLVKKTFTTPEGVFIFNDLSAGMYSIGLARDSTLYDPATYVVYVLSDGKTSPVSPTFFLAKAKTAGKVHGVVQDLTGALQKDALVRFVSVSTGNFSEITTQDDGKYAFSDVAGVYQLMVNKANFVPEIATITLVAGQDQIYDVKLGPKSTLKGVVKLNTTGETLPNVLVELFYQNTLKASQQTTAAGEFVFQDLTPNYYQLQIANGSQYYTPATYSIQILNDGSVSPANPELFISPKLAEDTDIRHPLASGTIYDAYTKAPLEYVNCSLKGIGSTYSDSQGRFSFANLLTGNYEITFSKTGWQNLTVNFSITEKNGVTVLNPSPLTYEMIQIEETGVGAITGRYIDENTLDGVEDLIVRLYIYRLVTKTIQIMDNGNQVAKEVSHWELDGGANPVFILSTKTGVTGSGNETARGTFRLGHLKPTTDDMKYLVWVGRAGSPAPTMTSVAYNDPADVSTPRVIWYQENISDPNRVHSWSLVDVAVNTTTFLQNFNLPNN